jgi:hypothetical protein
MPMANFQLPEFVKPDATENHITKTGKDKAVKKPILNKWNIAKARVR